MINTIVESYNSGKRIKLILQTGEIIKLYTTFFTLSEAYFIDEYDNENLYLVSSFTRSSKVRIIPAHVIREVVY